MTDSCSTSISEIEREEARFLDAMRRGDLPFLENAFSDNYLFLGADGSTSGKERALADFRNPGFELARLDVSDCRITADENTAVVTGRSHIEGRIGENSLTGQYLFMRVWTRRDDGWKVIAVKTSAASAQEKK